MCEILRFDIKDNGHGDSIIRVDCPDPYFEGRKVSDSDCQKCKHCVMLEFAQVKCGYKHDKEKAERRENIAILSV